MHCFQDDMLLVLLSLFIITEPYFIRKVIQLNQSFILNSSPPVLGKDVIGLAETGSGKTGAFAIPILQALLQNPQRYFALILTPTRELAFQISEQFEALGKM